MGEAERSVEPTPIPGPGVVLLRVFVEAYLATAHEKPRRRARAFLDHASRLLATEESLARSFPLRPSGDHAAMTQARQEAIALYRAFLPTFIAAIPPEDI